MEKLIELVYYYNSHLEEGQIGIGLTTSIKDDEGREVPFDKEKEIRKYENYIISKKYGFIERLVKNDKIDLGELFTSDIEIPLREVDGGNDVKMFSTYESLLMILSIQDNPIEYLCSILK